MDWKHIESLTPSAINEETKDELLNCIAWYDLEQDDEVDFNRSKLLVKFCQEILRYKSEQVDALLAELDEIAVKQAEQEAKSDTSSYRSKKSDLDDLDFKYRELKVKNKKLMKVVEKSHNDVEKLNKRIKGLEKERLYLQQELQQQHHHDDSNSDISEVIKDQHKDLIENIQQKNNQIASLLSDIENVEGDNLVLKSKLHTLHDELADATGKLTNFVEENEVYNVKVNNLTETINDLKNENASLHSQITDITDDKKQREEEFDNFAKEINVRVEEWKKILDEKNNEIAELTQKVNIGALTRSSSSTSINKSENVHLNALNKAISERDAKLLELQQQIEKATSEMNTNTKLLKKLSSDNTDANERINSLNSLIKDLKKKLKSSHSRCQQFQDDIKHQQDVIQLKQAELNRFIDNNLDIDYESKQLLKEQHNLKSELLAKEKEIADLVRDGNKMEAKQRAFEKENSALRLRFGLSEDDFVSTNSVSQQHRKQKRVIQELNLKLQKNDEEIIHLRLEVQKLSKIIANLTQQLYDLDETPMVEGIPTIDKQNIKNDKDYAAVIDENDALRKGMHEILESLHNKQETTSCIIKSETLEKLLRALDVKHVAGWYHPAMRLQAELHALQGTNAELREQLRIVREELEKSKELHSIEHQPFDDQSCNATSFLNLNKHLLNVLRNYHLEEETNSNLIKKLEDYKREFTIIQEQVSQLYNQYIDEKTKWEDELNVVKQQKNECENLSEVYKAKWETCETFNDAAIDDKVKVEKAMEMAADLVTLNRKLIYLENEIEQNMKQYSDLKDDFVVQQTKYETKLIELNEHTFKMQAKVNLYEEQHAHVKQSHEFVKLQSDYENLLIKQRQIISSVEDIRNFNANEFELLRKEIDLLRNEKNELFNSLKHSDEEPLSPNELKERQRANHTNSLYELVKEQLQKSEERCKQLQKYNSEIIQNNLVFQENVKHLENKLLNYVDEETFNQLDTKYLNVVEKYEKLLAEKNAMALRIDALSKDLEDKKLARSLEQYQFLSLKHQIVDLQAIGDDKSVIARLSSDVVVARTAEAENRRKLENLIDEFSKFRLDNADAYSKLDDSKRKVEFQYSSILRKNRNLEDIIKQQRRQYMGHVPFSFQLRHFDNIVQIYNDKLQTYEKWREIQATELDIATIKQQFESKIKILNDLDSIINEKHDEEAKIIQNWYNDKTTFDLRLIKYKKQYEFKETQLNEAVQRLTKQEEQIMNLEKELLQQSQFNDKLSDMRDETISAPSPAALTKETIAIGIQVDVKRQSFVNEQISIETQTMNLSQSSNDAMKEYVVKLENEVALKEEQILNKHQMIIDLKKKIAEYEMNINLFRQQIGDKQSQITFYERHIIELQEKKELLNLHPDAGQLQTKLADLQGALNEKENIILNYQALLKKDRDEHSLAAARFQEELKCLQTQLAVATMKANKFDESHLPSPQHPPSSNSTNQHRQVVEYYIQQVHTLEKHTDDLRTTVTTVSNQLEASREESVRWRTLSNDRLGDLDALRISLEEQHRNELQTYKVECDKWRTEVRNLQLTMSRCKKDITDLRPDIEKEVKDKDNRIHELSVVIRQLRTELRRTTNKQQAGSHQSMSAQDENFELVKENLLKEHDVLKKRFEQLMNREKTAREEIRQLKGRLMKRPILSARSDTTATKEQQLQKKITSLERECDELKQKLEHETAINEAHKVKVVEDFEKWNKQKSLQQSCDKLKTKLKEKHEENEKLQHTCSSYRMLIERLEREKHTHEMRMKNAKHSPTSIIQQASQFALLESVNAKLNNDITLLKERLEMQQHHAGGLGAAMLQDKLEAQERKIAILELCSKGPVEMRAELERLQSTCCGLQKENLRLEAENLESRLDLEKSCKELPHLREQLAHLETYTEALKAENAQFENMQHQVTNAGDHSDLNKQQPHPNSTKRVAQLERTVFLLKRIVEKLQVENKRLLGIGINGRETVASDRWHSSERLRRDNARMKEQNVEHLKRIARLEKELQEARTNRTNVVELENVKEELQQKVDLLSKVKVLLHKAAAKEKALLEQISSLKGNS